MKSAYWYFLSAIRILSLASAIILIFTGEKIDVLMYIGYAIIAHLGLIELGLSDSELSRTFNIDDFRVDDDNEKTA